MVTVKIPIAVIGTVLVGLTLIPEYHCCQGFYWGSKLHRSKVESESTL